MLHWRIILAAIAIPLVLGLAWLDQFAPRPGLIMLPLALVGAWMGAAELLGFFKHAGANTTQPIATGDQLETAPSVPSAAVVYAGTILTVLASTAPMTIAYPDGGAVGRVGWIAVGLIASLLLALCYEMAVYDGPGQPAGTVTTRLSRTMFAVVYVGGLMGFVVQLRILAGGIWHIDGRWGMLALLTTIAVVKANDTCAYIAGHAFGKHRMTPKLSPGKTWEGIAGGFVGSIAAALVFLGPVARWLDCVTDQSTTEWLVRTVVYALVVGTVGIGGDLAESLLKRDAGVKDSSTWMPGFGGFLDLLDSILLAAPVSYLLWVANFVGP